MWPMPISLDLIVKGFSSTIHYDILVSRRVYTQLSLAIFHAKGVSPRNVIRPL